MLSHTKALSLCAAVVAASASIAVTAAPAFAKSDPVVVTGQRVMPERQVSYRDLNLASARDQRLLLRRVDRAVGEVCDEVNVTLAQFDHDSACRSATWKSTQPQIALAIDRAGKGGTASYATLSIVAQPAA